MKRDLKLYLLTVGVPAILLALAGARLVVMEKRHVARVAAIEARRARRDGAVEECRGTMPPKLSHPFAGRRPRGPRGQVGGRRGGMVPRVFLDCPPEDAVAGERVLWIGGCVVGLLFLSLVSGAWLLARSAHKAREEAMRKTDFLSNVSHEFKTPLTSICLCAELAQDDGMDPVRRKKALASIASEANRLKALVLSALDFSRLEKGKRVFDIETCDLARIVRDCAESMAERFREGGLAVRADAPVPAKADKAAVAQIVAILLDNAAKYAAARGTVEISAGRGSGRPCISVADRGNGVARSDMKRMFERFWRGDDATTAETGGSGLGLSIALSLARGMGGDLKAAPRQGGGLVFTLELEP